MPVFLWEKVTYVITEILGHKDTHFHTYSYNQSILKKRMQEIDLVSKGNDR